MQGAPIAGFGGHQPPERFPLVPSPKSILYSLPLTSAQKCTASGAEPDVGEAEKLLEVVVSETHDCWQESAASTACWPAGQTSVTPGHMNPPPPTVTDALACALPALFDTVKVGRYVPALPYACVNEPDAQVADGTLPANALSWSRTPSSPQITE